MVHAYHPAGVRSLVLGLAADAVFLASWRSLAGTGLAIVAAFAGTGRDLINITRVVPNASWCAVVSAAVGIRLCVAGGAAATIGGAIAMDSV